jgi:hypothetical protein
VIVAVGDDFGCCGDPHREGWARAFGLDGSPRWTSAFEVPGIRPRLFDAAQAVAVGALGRIYVAGWAALRRITVDGEPVPCVLVVQKLGPDGGSVWTWATAIHGARRSVEVADIAARGPLVMLAARLGDRISPTSPSRGTAWIGRLSFDGRLRWSRTWGDDDASGMQPADVAIGTDGTTYVAGFVRAPSQERLRGFVRAFAATGRREWTTTFAAGSDSLFVTGVATRLEDLLVSATELTGRWGDERGAGHVWSFDLGAPRQAGLA